MLAVALAAAVVVSGRGQAPAQPTTTTSTVWTVISTDGRRPMATTPSNGREMVTTDELGRVFGVEFREDPLTRGLSLTVQGKTIVISPTTGLASIGGRVVTLSTPPVRGERGWSLPMDVVDRALALVYQPRLDVRPATHLIVVGDTRVPRVQVRLENQPRLARVHFDVTPATPHTVVVEPGRIIVRFYATALDLELAAAGSRSSAVASKRTMIRPGSTTTACGVAGVTSKWTRASRGWFSSRTWTRGTRASPTTIRWVAGRTSSRGW